MLTHEALLLLFKPKRAWISDSRRAGIARVQKTCINCNEDLGDDYEIDHVQPLASFGDNSAENLVATCAACHAQKSHLECLTRLEPDPITSELSSDVYEHFVSSPKPHQMYINAKMFGNRPRCLADITKCRYSALYENI